VTSWLLVWCWFQVGKSASRKESVCGYPNDRSNIRVVRCSFGKDCTCGYSVIDVVFAMLSYHRVALEVL